MVIEIGKADETGVLVAAGASQATGKRLEFVKLAVKHWCFERVSREKISQALRISVRFQLE